MPSAISLLLLAIAGTIGLGDWLWAEKAGFAVAGHAYLRIAAISGACWLAGWFYAPGAFNTMLLAVAGRNQERGTVA